VPNRLRGSHPSHRREADRAAYRNYVAAQEAARLEKQKSIPLLVNPTSLPPM